MSLQETSAELGQFGALQERTKDIYSLEPHMRKQMTYILTKFVTKLTYSPRFSSFSPVKNMKKKSDRNKNLLCDRTKIFRST